jgi:polar amino acid transport system substrate-binding protein
MAHPLPSLKRAPRLTATLPWVYSLMLVLAAVVHGEDATVPLFRNADKSQIIDAAPPKPSLRLLADADFPPFSYGTASGGAAGLSVDLGLFACGELKITCSVIMKPFHQLLPSLLRNEGDVIISGMKIDDKLMANATMTRPYFWSFGRFAVKRGSKLKASDAASLDGQTIGYVEGSAHGAWLEKYYSGATLTPFANEKEMHAALKTGKVEAIFTDNLRLVYWIDGSSANGCCATLGAPYVDRAFFSRNVAFILRRDDEATRKALDAALDRLQEKMTASEVIARYLPPGFW